MTRFPLSALAAVALVAGCDSKPTSGGLYSGDAHLVSNLIEEMNDAKASAPRAKRLFAQGSFPPEFKKYFPYTFYAADKPKLEGAGASAEVAIRKEDGTDMGKQTWTFVKEGEAWKIKAAPLP
jgi:hypothetical protein